MNRRRMRGGQVKRIGRREGAASGADHRAGNMLHREVRVIPPVIVSHM
jgi:hypothetical protein